MRWIGLFAFFCIGFILLRTSISHAQSYCVSRTKSSLYTSPSSTSKVKEEILHYTPARGTGKKESGYIEVVLFDGTKGWVRSSHLTTQTSCIVVKVSKSRMRSGPGEDFEKRDLAEKGTPFQDFGGEDGWTEVEMADGTKSWINLDHVWRPTSRVRMSFDAE